MRLTRIAIAGLLLSAPWQVALAGEAEYSLGMSLKEESFAWNIAGDGNGQNPNVLSELTWDGVRSAQLSGEFRIPIARWGRYPISLRGEGGYGWILDGTNQDSDYAADNRRQEVSRSHNRADAGTSMQFSVGVGSEWVSSNNRWHLEPAIGAGYEELNLVIRDGRQVLPNDAPIDGLNSRYAAQWQHLWASLDVRYQYSSRVDLGGSLAYQRSEYQADANWNLRDDFQHPLSFRHLADGDGFSFALAGNYRINRFSSLRLGLEYAAWSSDPGTDQVYFSDGSTEMVRLNRVERTGRSISLGWQRAF